MQTETSNGYAKMAALDVPAAMLAEAQSLIDGALDREWPAFAYQDRGTTCIWVQWRGATIKFNRHLLNGRIWLGQEMSVARPHCVGVLAHDARDLCQAVLADPTWLRIPTRAEQDTAWASMEKTWDDMRSAEERGQ